METIARNKRNYLIFGSLTAVVVAAFGFILFGGPSEETPPSLSIGSRGLQGFIQDSSKFRVFEAGDVFSQQKKTEFTTTHGTPTERAGGVWHFYSESEVSFSEVLSLINAEAGTRCMIATYANNRFDVYPQGPYVGTNVIADNQLSTYKVAPYHGINLICDKTFQVWKLKPSTAKPTSFNFSLKTAVAGWHLIAMDSDTNLRGLVNSCKNRLSSIWVQKADNQSLVFQKGDLNNPTLVAGNYLVWYRVNPESGAACSEYVPVPSTSTAPQAVVNSYVPAINSTVARSAAIASVNFVGSGSLTADATKYADIKLQRLNTDNTVAGDVALNISTFSFQNTTSTSSSTKTLAFSYPELQASTKYRITIPATAIKNDGTPLASNVVWEFNTNASTATAPTVDATSYVPANNSTTVAIASGIAEVAFNGANLSLVESQKANIKIYPLSGTPEVRGAALTINSAAIALSTVDTNKKKIAIPYPDLANSTRYEVVIPAAAILNSTTPLATDVSWKFQTVATTPTGTAPTVSSTIPANNATGVASQTNIANVIFNSTGDITHNTNQNYRITLNKITVSGTTETVTPVSLSSATISFAATTKTLSISGFTLEAGSNYRVFIPKEIISANGLNLAADYTFNFSTATAQAPAATVTTVPANNATGVPVTNATFVLSYAPTTGVYFYDNTKVPNIELKKGSTLVDSVGRSVSSNGTQKTVTIVYPTLEAATDYVLTIPADLVKIDGQPLTAAKTISFRTITPSVTISSSAFTPTSGATNVSGNLDKVTVDFIESGLTLDSTKIASITVKTIATNAPNIVATGTAIAPLSTTITSSRLTIPLTASALLPGKTYTVTIPVGTIKNGATSNATALTWSFSTSAFSVLSVPADVANNVAIDSNIVLTFSGGSYTYDSTKIAQVKLREADALANEYPISVTSPTSQGVLTINPINNLRPDTRYNLLFPKDIVKSNGLALASDFELIFTTSSSAQLTISSVLPLENASEVNKTSPVIVSFAEAGLQLDSTKIQYISIKSPDSSIVSSANPNHEAMVGPEGYSLSYFYDQVVYDAETKRLVIPHYTLYSNTTYLVSIPAGIVKDSANNLSPAKTWSFVTGE